MSETNKGVYMKFFVLKPSGQSIYARASREAMRTYAHIVKDENPELCNDLDCWIKSLEGLWRYAYRPKALRGPWQTIEGKVLVCRVFLGDGQNDPRMISVGVPVDVTQDEFKDFYSLLDMVQEHIDGRSAEGSDQ